MCKEAQDLGYNSASSALSPKGTSELIYKDAAASIRCTGQDSQYQLVIQRAYEEGEAELLADEEGEDGAGDALDTDKDEKTFLLDQTLHFRSEFGDNDEKGFAWQDLSGGPGDTASEPLQDGQALK